MKFHIIVASDKSPISESPGWRFSSGPRLCDPRAVAIQRKLTDMKLETKARIKTAKHSLLENASTSLSNEDHKQRLSDDIHE